ncbi:sensor histidine kinase [Nonomuraea antimicrobica]
MTKVDRDGPLAVLAHDPALLEDPELIQAACAAASLALENERLTADLRARLRQLADSRAHLVRAAEAERRRLERDLHDGVQQRLLAIPLTLSLAEAALASRPERVGPLIGEARDTALAALDEVRALAQGIHPPILTERGLVGAVCELAAVAPVPVAVSSDVSGDLPAEVETTAYYVVAEALANLAKHAAADRASVSISRASGWLSVEISDNGRGAADPERGSGLRGLTGRVETNGGSLHVHSPPGQGTRIEAMLPCA